MINSPDIDCVPLVRSISFCQSRW